MARFKPDDWIVGPKGNWYKVDDINEVSYCLLNTKGHREINSIDIVDKCSIPLSVYDIMGKIPSEVLKNLKFD